MAWHTKMPWALGVLLCMGPSSKAGDTAAQRTTSTVAVSTCPLRAKGLDIDLPLFSIFVNPDELVAIEMRDGDSEYRVDCHGGGTATRFSRRAWIWRAPKTPGLNTVVTRSLTSGDSTTLNCFVMVPSDNVHRGILNGYRIGAYPAPRDESYAKPTGFLEVTPALEDAMVSPHFRVRDFLCRQAADYPKYAVIRERLVLKLEYILTALHDAGHTSARIVVKNGYRTPFYNARTGNVVFSRHVWGDAADIYVDGDEDGLMDDLNGDGRCNLRDARVLYNTIDALDADSVCAGFRGGLGLYGGPGFRTPFVHVDARGEVTRWQRYR